MSAAIYVQDSQNSKLAGSGKIDATYAPIEGTCPPSCSLKKNRGCYALYSYVGIVVDRLQKKSRGMSPLQIARVEAKAIDNSYNGRPIPAGRHLRLHVSGDSRTVKGTRVLSKAVSRWKRRGGLKAYTYTHAWKAVPRKEWGDVSVLASVSTLADAQEAQKLGYAPALVVPEHPGDKSYKLNGSDITWIPCPAQTKENVGCSDCKLCMNDHYLVNANRGITFAVHGVNKNKLKKHLTVIQ